MKEKKLFPDMLFNDWCDYWLTHTKYSRSLTTNAKYEEIVKRVIQPDFQAKILSGIQLKDVQVFLNSLALKGLKSSRISMIQSILNMIMEYAVDHNLIMLNPAANSFVAKSKRYEAKVLNDEDVMALLNLEDDSRYVPVILLTLFLGLRIGETLGLSWNNIDLEAGTVKISQQLTSYYDNQTGKTVQALLPYTKTRENRELPLPEIARELLREQKKITSIIPISWPLPKKTEARSSTQRSIIASIRSWKKSDGPM